MIIQYILVLSSLGNIYALETSDFTDLSMYRMDKDAHNLMITLLSVPPDSDPGIIEGDHGVGVKDGYRKAVPVGLPPDKDPGVSDDFINRTPPDEDPGTSEDDEFDENEVIERSIIQDK